MGYRWRRMYYSTGLPGWMRFGYSPGWVDRSPTGLSPAAEWIVSSGSTSQFRDYLKSRKAPPTAIPYSIGSPVNKEEEIQMLEEQAKVVETQLSAIKNRLEAIEKSASTKQSPNYPFMPYGYPPKLAPEDELSSLEDYKRNIEKELKSVDDRIKELRRLKEDKPSP